MTYLLGSWPLVCSLKMPMSPRRHFGAPGSGSLLCLLPPQNCMNLPPDKVQLLSQYDNEKKWELICDQVGTRPLQGGAGTRGGTAMLPIGPRPCAEASIASGESAGGVCRAPNSPLLDMGVLGDLMSHEQGWVCPLKKWQRLVQALASAAGTVSPSSC